MLKGVLKYNDEHFQTPVEMTVYAKDTGVLNLYLCDESGAVANETAMLTLWDATITKTGEYVMPTEFGQKNRRLNIKRASKIQTNLQNMLFANRVAALVRYCEEMGVRQGVDNASQYDDKIYSSEFTYDVTSSDGVSLGTYKKKLGYLIEMHISNKYVTIDLEYFDEDTLDVQMFETLKQKDRYGNVLSKTPIKNTGFKFSETLLGFEYVPLCSKVESDATAMLSLYTTLDEVIAAHPDKNYTWLNNRKYEIVTDETLDEVMERYNNYEGVIGIDTETSGLNITFQSREGHGDQLVGICLSMEEGTGHYFPLQMKYIKNLCGGDHWFFMERYMKKFCETKKFVTHNLSFDWKVFYIYDIDLNVVFDTMLAYGVTERYKQPNFEYGLKDLTHNIFGWDMIELSDMLVGGSWGKGKNKNMPIGFWDLSYELVKNYAPTDADMTLTLYNYVMKIRLLENFRAEEVFKIELVYAKVIAYSEFFGYHIDIDRLPELIATIEKGKQDNMNKLFELAGEEFNPNSTKDLTRIMYDKLGIPDVSKKRSTDKEALKELAGMTDQDGNPLYPFAMYLKSYRDSEGIYKNFLKRKDEFLTPDGFIFPHVYTFGTNTGRVAVKEPNYQSYNDAIKKFVCPRTGFKMWDSDFSQIEYRVLCSMAHEPALIESFADPDMDYHTYQAARMFGVPYGAVTKQMRQQCKGINFGLPYGMGDASLGARIFGARNATNTQKAARLRELYFEGQDNIRNFFDTVRDEGVKNGYTRTLYGRLRYYHKGTFSEGAIRRQAGNHVIQGTAADLYKLACCRVFEMMKQKGWLGKVLLNAFIHDEILGEVSEEIDFYEFVEEWRKAFEVPVEGFCKLYAGLGIGNSWYEAKKADWPPQLIDIIINSPNKGHWDGDGQKMIDWVKEAFYQYGIDRVTTAFAENAEAKANGVLTDHAKIIKPVIDAFLKEKVKDYLGSISDEEAEKLKEYLGKSDLKLGDLQEWVKAFCFWQKIDYETLDILAPDADIKTNQNEETEEPIQVDLPEMETDVFLFNSVKIYGFMLDVATNRLFVNLDMLRATNRGGEFVSLFGKENGTYRLCSVSFTGTEPTIFETEAYVLSADILLMQTFLQDTARIAQGVM